MVQPGKIRSTVGNVGFLRCPWEHYLPLPNTRRQMFKDDDFKAFERQIHRMDSCLTLAYAYYEQDQSLGEYYIRLAKEYFDEVAGAAGRTFSVLENEKKRGIYVS